MKLTWFDLNGENSIILGRLKRKWGLRRIYRSIYQKYPPIGESLIIRHILFCCALIGKEVTYKELYGLRQEVEKLSGEHLSHRVCSAGIKGLVIKGSGKKKTN